MTLLKVRRNFYLEENFIQEARIILRGRLNCNSGAVCWRDICIIVRPTDHLIQRTMQNRCHVERLVSWAEHQCLVWAWYHLSMDCRLPCPQLDLCQQKVGMILDICICICRYLQVHVGYKQRDSISTVGIQKWRTWYRFFNNNNQNKLELDLTLSQSRIEFLNWFFNF